MLHKCLFFTFEGSVLLSYWYDDSIDGDIIEITYYDDMEDSDYFFGMNPFFDKGHWGL